MKIARSGSKRYSGKASIEISKPSVRWSKDAAEIIISKDGVRDFSGSSRHDYEVTMSLDELAAVLDVAANPTPEGAASVGSKLENSLRALLRLVSFSVGPQRM